MQSARLPAPFACFPPHEQHALEICIIVNMMLLLPLPLLLLFLLDFNQCLFPMLPSRLPFIIGICAAWHLQQRFLIAILRPAAIMEKELAHANTPSRNF